MRQTRPDPRCHCIYLLHSRNFRYATVLTFSLLLIGFTASHTLIKADDNVSVDPQLLESLPPDPGSAGELTLEGIDSDNDGVRDDVQRWIALTYPNSEKVRSALTQQAKLSQLYTLNASDPTLSKSTARKILSSVDCLSYVSPDAYVAVARKFDAIFFNTYARSKAQRQADHHSSGTVFGSSRYENRKEGCNFDPDAMPN